MEQIICSRSVFDLFEGDEMPVIDFIDEIVKQDERVRKLEETFDKISQHLRRTGWEGDWDVQAMIVSYRLDFEYLSGNVGFMLGEDHVITDPQVKTHLKALREAFQREEVLPYMAKGR